MKPTQEQVLQWAREAGVYHIAPNVAGSLLYMSQASLYRGFFLAYEAGRKDENEACAKVCRSIADYFREHKDDMPPDLFDPVNAVLECDIAIRKRSAP